MTRIVGEEIFACWVEGYFGGKDLCLLLGRDIFWVDKFLLVGWREFLVGRFVLVGWERFVVGLAYQGKNIVFRFIIEYRASWILAPSLVIIGLFFYEDF